MKRGYARVSSKAQDYQTQIEALKAAGCDKIPARSNRASPGIAVLCSPSS